MWDKLFILRCVPVKKDGLNRSPSSNVSDSTCPVPVCLNGPVHNLLHSIRQKQVCLVQPVLTASLLASCSQWTHIRHKLLKVLHQCSNPHTLNVIDLNIKLQVTQSVCGWENHPPPPPHTHTPPKKSVFVIGLSLIGSSLTLRSQGPNF